MKESVWPDKVKRDPYTLSDVVIIGKEKEAYYLGIIADKGSQHDSIVLKATRPNLNKLEYAKAKMQYWGLVEDKRAFIVEDLRRLPRDEALPPRNVEVCVVTLKKIKELVALKKGLNANANVR